ncbi:uncharacterized protein EV154DRAFT_525286 [Mucor mucedo]|uniref:uncharacterized protein n=1 Tax=Mucor mucedo TaxID=29922 RepID=UPI00221F1A71|nr:uncharacterized protein EV154DRAFT_525286 [Mucor mucedo]KAI7877888.1 hypothetical protein EV154DRAFT_525286 [Mucor mucedo]
MSEPTATTTTTTTKATQTNPLNFWTTPFNQLHRLKTRMKAMRKRWILIEKNEASVLTSAFTHLGTSYQYINPSLGEKTPLRSSSKYRSSKYQIRSYLKAFKNLLADTMRPGRYMCVDDSMNKWLKNRMSKIPRKFHPLDQEYERITSLTLSCAWTTVVIINPTQTLTNERWIYYSHCEAID